MSDSTVEMLIPPKAKRSKSEIEENTDSTVEMLIPPNAKNTKTGRNTEGENEENKDMLSDLSDCILLHILSFVSAKNAVQTCVLSTRWKDLWKRLPTLRLHSRNFSTLKIFDKFLSRILTLRDGSIALDSLDFEHGGSIRPHLIKRIVNYTVSLNVQRLGICVAYDMQRLLPCIFTCHTLTSLKLIDFNGSTLFPKSLNLPALTTLHLENFTFCSSGNDRADPFSALHRLNSLIIDLCKVKDAGILSISNITLANLTLRSSSWNLYTIELSTPCLYRLACTGFPSQNLCGSGLSSVEKVNIDVNMRTYQAQAPSILLSWLRGLGNVTSLTVSTNTLQVLFLVPDLLEIKLSSLANLKRLKIKRERMFLMLRVIVVVMRFDSSTAGSRKEAVKLRKELAKFQKEAAPLPDGIVDFLTQKSKLTLCRS